MAGPGALYKTKFSWGEMVSFLGVNLTTEIEQGRFMLTRPDKSTGSEFGRGRTVT